MFLFNGNSDCAGRQRAIQSHLCRRWSSVRNNAHLKPLTFARACQKSWIRTPTLFEWNLRAFGLQKNKMFLLYLDQHGDLMQWKSPTDAITVNLPTDFHEQDKTCFFVHDKSIYLNSLQPVDIHKGLRASLAILRDEEIDSISK